MSRVDFPNRLNKVRRQLNHILNDHRYYQNDSTREFTISMYTAFGKRKITKKMEIAMDRIISNYTKWQSDNSKLETSSQIKSRILKISNFQNPISFSQKKEMEKETKDRQLSENSKKETFQEWYGKLNNEKFPHFRTKEKRNQR